MEKWPVGPMNGRLSPHGYDSWYPVFHALASAIDAKSCLEIGTGRHSTRILGLGFENIDSLETDTAWFNKTTEDFVGYPRTVTFCHRESHWLASSVARRWDICLVDGSTQDRGACIAALLDGRRVRVAVCHDYEEGAMSTYRWPASAPSGWVGWRWRCDFPEVGIFCESADQQLIDGALREFRDACYDDFPGGPRERGFHKLGKGR